MRGKCTCSDSFHASLICFTILVMEGIVFVAILLSETLYGRIGIFKASFWRADP